MLGTRPYLTTLRPSPTTVSYTVSTASRCSSLASLMLYYIVLSIRMVLGVSILTMLFVKTYEESLPYFLSQYPLAQIHDYPWSHVLPLSFCALFLVSRRFHTGRCKIYIMIYWVQFKIAQAKKYTKTPFLRRRVTPGSSIAGYSDNDPLILLPAAQRYAFHSNVSDT